MTPGSPLKSSESSCESLANHGLELSRGAAASERHARHHQCKSIRWCGLWAAQFNPESLDWRARPPLSSRCG